MELFNNNPWFTANSCRVRLVSVTPDAEKTIAYVARVSNPKNQENEKFEGLLRYCVKQGHVSVFEQADMTVEVITPLAIAAQLLRHQSFDFQQLSLRYSNQQELHEVLGSESLPFYLPEEARLQDSKNRQNSIFANDLNLDEKMRSAILAAYEIAETTYNNLIAMGVCKEQARFVLPVGSYTRLYVKGNARSWMHYLKVRSEEGVVQWEHVELARTIQKVFAEQFPTIHKAFFEESAEYLSHTVRNKKL